MAIIKAVNSKSSIGKAINYVTKEEKTEEKLISGIDCNPKTALDEMKATKELYDKDNGRQYAHFIQSFNPKDNISPEKAHEIGKEFIKNNDKFNGHEIIMATHKDKDHIHNHFIINSVNYETGLKLHTTKYEYQAMKDISNKLSKEHGLTVPEKSEVKGKITSFNQNKYQAMKKHFEGKGKSYIVETAVAVKKAQEKAISKDTFIKEMDKQGYKTNWEDASKNVTFINKDTEKRVRLSNLEKTFNDKDFTKGGLNNEFERNHREGEISREGKLGSKESDNRNKGTEQPDEKLYNGSHGQGFNQPADSIERDTSNRGDEYKDTRTDGFDIGKAKANIRKTAGENARNISSLSKPDARKRDQADRKARELERANSEKHAERTKQSRSRSRELER